MKSIIQPRWAGLFIALCLGLVSAASAHAFNLKPMEQEFSLDGRGTNHTFTVTNTQKKAISLEVTMMDRVVDNKGRESHRSTEDFFFFPKQIQLQPGQSQAIRVTWRGPKNLKSEKAYRLIVNQLPVNAAELKQQGRVNLKYVMKFVASLYATPAGAKSKVDVQHVGSDAKVVRLKLTNAGSKHQKLTNIKLVLNQGAGREVVVTGKHLGPLQKVNLLAGNALDFYLNRPPSFDPNTPVQAQVQF